MTLSSINRTNPLTKYESETRKYVEPFEKHREKWEKQQATHLLRSAVALQNCFILWQCVPVFWICYVIVKNSPFFCCFFFIHHPFPSTITFSDVHSRQNAFIHLSIHLFPSKISSRTHYLMTFPPLNTEATLLSYITQIFLLEKLGF